MPNSTIIATLGRWAGKLLARMLLALFACLLTLLGVELVLRLARADDEAVLRHDRSLITYYPSGERLNPWSDGHPDPLRVAVVGDSITHGAGVTFYDTYGMRLEALLNFNPDQRPAKVRVWALGGDSTHTQLRYLQEIIPWNPELLILGICLNDTEDPHNAREYRRWRREALPPPPPPWLARLLPRTRAGTWIYQQFASIKAQQGYHRYYERLYDKNYSGWHVFVQTLRTFNETCREHGITFVPVIFPTFDNVDNYPFEWIHDQIKEVLRAENIPYFDLLDTFRGQSPVRLQAIPNVDPHPSEIAHRLAAESIFQFLLANGHIDASYLPQHANASPERMWRMLAHLLQDASAVDADDYERLLHEDEAVTVP